MAHQIDFSNGRANTAYVGETPWHGLGQRLLPEATIDEWVIAAGLSFEAKESPIHYQTEQGPIAFPGKKALYRSDTMAGLGVVSTEYQPVQPRTILDTFEQMSEVIGMKLETAGSLFDGRRVWGMAKIDGFDIDVKANDTIKPYLLLCTSFDGTLATTAKFTSVRVVCNNTLSLTIGAKEEENAAGFRDTLKIRHIQEYKPEMIERFAEGWIASWNDHGNSMKKLASESVDARGVDRFLCDLFLRNAQDAEDVKKLRDSAAYNNVVSLFEQRNQIGSDGSMSKWMLLNAVTEYTDWSAGRMQSNRLESAWFGAGSKLKQRAADLLLAA